MDYNTILRSLRYAMKIDDQQVADIFKQNGYNITAEEVADLLKQEEDEGFVPADDKIIRNFLDGLILSRRGPRKPGSKAVSDEVMNNNIIMKKIRIAFELREEDMIRVIEDGGFAISKGELSALFRKKGHKHYRPCGDQLLRNFLRGLSGRKL